MQEALPTAGSPALWITFVAVVCALLAVDLGLLNRRAHTIHVKEAAIWSGVWIALAGAFAATIGIFRGARPAIEFVTAYVMEKALSVDNLFVFVVVLAAFQVPRKLEHRVLFWGILGAIVLRGVFIVAGLALIRVFSVTLYVFGALLVFTGVKLFLSRNEVETGEGPAVRFVRRHLKMAKVTDDKRFFVRHEGKILPTSLFAVLVTIELTDVLFALDSIPAVLGITTDPFIVFTSNIFAILGLRSLYFVLARGMAHVPSLKMGLSLVLLFVGAKMLAGNFVHVPALVSLAAVAVLLGAPVLWARVVDGRVRVPPARPSGAET
jgi:tellurite resistance protein TerC